MTKLAKAPSIKGAELTYLFKIKPQQPWMNTLCSIQLINSSKIIRAQERRIKRTRAPLKDETCDL